MRRIAILLAAVLLIAAVRSCQAQGIPKGLLTRGGRSVTVAPHGMVATSHPLAAEIGLDVLKRGGNAIDAAIATDAALGLMEPMSCGVGGDLYAIVWDAKTKRLYGLNASGRSPYRATMAYFASKGLKDIPGSGPLSWSVPGCVNGWDQLRRRFGTMSFKQLLAPTIRYADEGEPVPETIAFGWMGAAPMLRRTPEMAATYLPDGKPPVAGSLFKNPRLARTYREIAAGGRDAYYKGRIAREIVAYSDKVGGLFSLKDFEDNVPTWVEPVSTNYRGYNVWEIPPPSQGIAVLQMLNILEGFDLAAMGRDSPDFWHVMIEAKKLVYADRARYYADPAFAAVPVKELISKEYANSRRKLIDMNHALTNVEPGDPKLGKSDTIYLTVVDKDRNCVSLIQSNFNAFGSGYAAGNLGFCLQNRGELFSLDPHHPNHLEPHKRPFHTIIPAMVTKDGKPWFSFGVMGGDMQPQGQVQVLVNMIDFGLDVQQAGETPRIEHVGSASPKGRPGSPDGGTLLVEKGIPQSTLDELTRRGHHVRPTLYNGGGYQGILIDWEHGTLLGASERRRDGAAVGY